MTDKILYRIGILFLFAGLAAAFLYHTGVFSPTALLPPCQFHALTGLYCPGCGATRAVEALLSGHFLACLRHHPFIFYCFAVYLLFMISHTQSRMGRKHFISRHKTTLVCIGVIVLFAQWLLKNLILFFPALYLP